MPGGEPGGYPASVKTSAQRALYNNLDKNEEVALAVDAAVQGSRMDGWRGNAMKTKRVRLAIKAVLLADCISLAITTGDHGCRMEETETFVTKCTDEGEILVDRILDLVRKQYGY